MKGHLKNEFIFFLIISDLIQLLEKKRDILRERNDY